MSYHCLSLVGLRLLKTLHYTLRSNKISATIILPCRVQITKNITLNTIEYSKTDRKSLPDIDSVSKNYFILV